MYYQFFLASSSSSHVIRSIIIIILIFVHTFLSKIFVFAEDRVTREVGDGLQD